ncbi:MAG: hypothetical protein SCALA701_29000 [Candidatus Scalindua sp.]|nr:MAG: hypothetical protein SCALA701_29000 [Candidatus Scalindua sp.]
MSNRKKLIIKINTMNLIINFTPTGMIPTKEMTPHVPVTVSEIVEDVHQAVEIGITMVHLHRMFTPKAKGHLGYNLFILN